MATTTTSTSTLSKLTTIEKVGAGAIYVVSCAGSALVGFLTGRKTKLLSNVIAPTSADEKGNY